MNCDERVIRRFLAKVDKRADGCWEWTASKTNRGGYGRFRYEGKIRLAHRVAYVLWVGSIPDGLGLDHLCRNRACVNPDHLEPVTQRENVARGEGNAAINLRKTECVNGHPLQGDNLHVTDQGWRVCRECSRAAGRRYYRRMVAK